MVVIGCDRTIKDVSSQQRSSVFFSASKKHVSFEETVSV